MAIKRVCPKCKSDDLAEINRVNVLLPIKKWEDDTDIDEPAEYGEWVTMDGTIDVYPEPDERYHCMNCEHEFREPERAEV